MKKETGIRKTLTILRLLTKEQQQVNDLVELTGIHQRQVYRAIAVLKESGYKVHKTGTAYRVYFDKDDYAQKKNASNR